MTSKEERKRLLIEIMKEDEKNGMYEVPPAKKGKREPILDGHGYEIFGLHTAKSKKRKIEILRGHIFWTENKHTEVLSDLKDMLDDLL